MMGAYNRQMSKRKARRRLRLDTSIRSSWDPDPKPQFDNLHQYSKNKIHCSCGLCNAKTRNKGKHRYRKGSRGYARAINYSAADLRKVTGMDFDMREVGYHTTRHTRTKYEGY